MAGEGMLPCVDEEAVEAAEGGEEERRREQSEAQGGTPGYGGDEDGGGEEDTYGDLFGEATCCRSRGGCAWCGVNEDEIAGEETTENEIKMQRGGFELGEKRGQGDGGEEDSGEEGFAVAMVKVMAGFEVFSGGYVE